LVRLNGQQMREKLERLLEDTTAGEDKPKKKIRKTDDKIS